MIVVSLNGNIVTPGEGDDQYYLDDDGIPRFNNLRLSGGDHGDVIMSLDFDKSKRTIWQIKPNQMWIMNNGGRMPERVPLAEGDYYYEEVIK